VSTFEVEILTVSAKGKFVFVVGETSGGGVGCGRRKAKKKRAVIAVWDGRKRGKIYPGYGGERDPVRLLSGHGGAIQSLYTPNNPGELLLKRAASAGVVGWHCTSVLQGSCFCMWDGLRSR